MLRSPSLVMLSFQCLSKHMAQKVNDSRPQSPLTVLPPGGCSQEKGQG